MNCANTTRGRRQFSKGELAEFAQLLCALSFRPHRFQCTYVHSNGSSVPEDTTRPLCHYCPIFPLEQERVDDGWTTSAESGNDRGIDGCRAVRRAGVASAAPAFDPNNDGAVTVGEVLDAPLFPASLAPGLDGDGDGALSIGEVFEGRIPTNPNRCVMVDDGFICA